jgi:hypothetical protein
MTVRLIAGPRLGILGVALWSACGGGGSEPPPDSLSNAAAISYAANAGVVGADAASALDATLLTATDLVVASASESRAATGRKQALSTSTGALACAGGGSAGLTITNAAEPAAELDGRLDAGEVYELAFSACRGAGSGVALSGALTMTVNSTSSNGATVTFATTTLSATLPRGVVSFSGSVTLQRTLVPAAAASARA